MHTMIECRMGKYRGERGTERKRTHQTGSALANKTAGGSARRLRPPPSLMPRREKDGLIVGAREHRVEVSLKVVANARQRNWVDTKYFSLISLSLSLSPLHTLSQSLVGTPFPQLLSF